MALTATACRTGVEAGIESANDLLFHKQYVDAERLYRKLLKRLDSIRELDDDQERQQLYVLDRLGKINAIYLNDYDQAIADYGLLVRLYPKTDQAFAARAMVADIYHHRLGNLQSAIDEYQRLVAQFPERPETQRTLLKISAAYEQLKNYEQARTEAEALINRWPDSPEATQARFQIANTYYIEGRYAEAVATYELLLQTNLEPSMRALVLFELGNCFQELTESERALDYYYASLADHPNPLLVQRKIQRMRTRLRRARPAQGVQHGGVLPRTRPRQPRPLAPSTQAAAASPANTAGGAAPPQDAHPEPHSPTHTSQPDAAASATAGQRRQPEPAPAEQAQQPKPTPDAPASKASPPPAAAGGEPEGTGDAPTEKAVQPPATPPPPAAEGQPEPAKAESP